MGTTITKHVEDKVLIQCKGISSRQYRSSAAQSRLTCILGLLSTDCDLDSDDVSLDSTADLILVALLCKPEGTLPESELSFFLAGPGETGEFDE